MGNGGEGGILATAVHFRKDFRVMMVVVVVLRGARDLLVNFFSSVVAQNIQKSSSSCVMAGV